MLSSGAVCIQRRIGFSPVVRIGTGVSPVAKSLIFEVDGANASSVIHLVGLSRFRICLRSRDVFGPAQAINYQQAHAPACWESASLPRLMAPQLTSEISILACYWISLEIGMPGVLTSTTTSCQLVTFFFFFWLEWITASLFLSGFFN